VRPEVAVVKTIGDAVMLVSAEGSIPSPYVDRGSLRRNRRLAIGEKANVLIENDYRRNVAFVMADVRTRQGWRRRAVGTAFFLRWPIKPDRWIIYAVTAGHVIRAAEVFGFQGLHLRIPVVHPLDAVAEQPTFRDFPTTASNWTRHPTTDVAVARLQTPPDSDLGIFPMPVEVLATAEMLADRNVGEGDEVFFTGLFYRFYGEQHMLPIVRFGNIALMPREPVPALLDPTPGAEVERIDAYLVEARSWGGHSGSPTWVYFPTTRNPKSPTWDNLRSAEPLLLGLVQGHYAIDEDEDFIGDLPGTRALAANAGIALVVPADKITEVLMDPEMKKEREQIVAEQEAESGGRPVQDSPAAETDDDYKRSEFERDLRKVTQPKSRDGRSRGGS
jgi:hypothetical protein